MAINVAVKDYKLFPEYTMFTPQQTSLGTGNSNLIRLHSIAQHSQIFKPLAMSFEQAASIAIQPVIDGQRQSGLLRCNQLGGIGIDFEMFGKSHPLGFATKEYILEAQNSSGSASTDFRSRLEGIIDAYDSATKQVLLETNTPQIKMSRRDLEAIDILNKRHLSGKPRIDYDQALRLGVGVPQSFEDFLKIHETTGSYQRVLSDSTDLSSSSRTELANIDVENRGKEAIVLESMFIERPAQSELGEVNCYISRDNDDDLITIDPADLAGDNTRTNFHIHSLKDIKIEFDLDSGTHNSFKASAIFSKRRIGLGWKAKMMEFLGENHLPEEIEISTKEKDEIDKLNLLEIARTGMIAIG